MSDEPRYCHKCKAWHSPTDAGWQGRCASSLAPAAGSADSLYGNCVVCGKYLGKADYDCHGVIAAIGPEGTIACCVGHLFYGPMERSPGYEDAIRKIAEAKATQCGWKPPNDKGEPSRTKDKI